MPKQIINVIVRRECYESYPCQHKVHIQYIDGSFNEKLMWSPDIIKILKRLKRNIPKHFLEQEYIHVPKV